MVFTKAQFVSVMSGLLSSEYINATRPDHGRSGKPHGDFSADRYSIQAIGVLSIPAGFSVLGAVGGALLVLSWGALTTYGALLMGNFR